MSDLTYDNTAPADAEIPPTPAGPPMTQEEWNALQEGVAYLTNAEFARQEQAESEAAWEQEQELAELFGYDPEAALDAVREQMSAELESHLAPIGAGLAEWQEERANAAVAQEVDAMLTDLEVPEAERERAYEIANEILADGVAEVAAAQGWSEDQVWAVAAHNPEVAEALDAFARNSLKLAANELQQRQATKGMDEVQLGRHLVRQYAQQERSNR